MPVAWGYVPNAPSHVFKKPSVIPGFGLALGFTLTYLCLIVLIPLAGLVLKTSALGWAEFWRIATDPRTLAALRVSFGAVAPRRGGERRLRAHRRLGAGALRVSRPPHPRRDRRPALRAADRRRRHRADRALCAERLDRAVHRAARPEDRLHADRHLHRARLHRPALRRAHACSRCWRTSSREVGGGGRHARRHRAGRPSSASSSRRSCRRS